MSGPPDHVSEQADGTVAVGKSDREKNKEKAKNASNQSDRIEAKLDLIMAELGVEE